ncbi:MAG TPA: TonB-dependent receptor [Phenylobacterium sp.]|uniref:TonB-dependent receptor n=1 Tax=Phenylobacterium sp. TaxID=1871053 RepID=UPI002B94D3B3|nr:TonB-dependent receptor [Phenylobacterium sp.]HSV01882.1 TonB-dependent receptor [Phenylobacterium sp.]
MVRNALFACASVLALATIGGATEAKAQTAAARLAPQDATEVGEVIVTARKRNERLRDVPVSASVVEGSEIAQRGGLQGVKDLVTSLPSVAFGDTSTPLTSEISIRGSGTSRGTSAESGVGLYRDGAYVGGGAQGGRTFSRFDLFDVSQIEVLRGTQGALYGRDAVGGAINVITARPTPTSSGYLSAKSGNVGLTEFEGVLNQPLTEHLSFRFSADDMKQAKGFYFNPDLDKYIDAQSTYAYRAQLRYDNGPFDANLMFEHAKNKYPALNLQLWVQPNPSEPRGIFIEPMFERPHNFEDSDTDQVNDVEFASHYQFGFGTLTWISLWRERKDLQQFDNDIIDPGLLAQIRAAGLLAPGVSLETNGTQQNHGRTRSFNQELYMTGDFGTRWKWLLGAEYLHLQDGDTITTTRTPTKANPSTGTVSISAQTLDSWATYGSLEYDFTDQLSVTGELRYTKDEKHFDANQFSNPGLVAVAGKLVDASFNPDNLSYELTGAYKVSPEWMAYAKVGTGFRAGGFNSNLGNPLQPIPIPVSYGNEETTTYEVGAKGNPVRQIYLTAAAYWTDVSNLIIQTDNGCKATNPACPVAATPFATNGGEAQLWGFEAEATINLPIAGGDLTATVGGSRQSGKITSGEFSGDLPPQLPKWLASANVNYSHPLPAGAVGFANLLYSARWGGVQEIEQTPELHDYQIVNLRAGVRRDHIEAALFANNLFDVTYLTFEATSARRWSEPRTYGAQISYRW